MQSLSGAGYRQACAASTSGRKAAPSSIGWQVSRHGAAAAARTGGSDSSSCSNSIHARCNVINPGGSPRFSGSSRNFSAEGVRLVFPERKNALREAVMQYYDEVWNAGAMDSLDDLVSDGVVYSDVLAHDSDTFGRPGLRQAVQEFQAGHPLAHFTVDETVVDDSKNTVVAHWHATAAHLLPTARSGPATGAVSEISGMDKFHFSDTGRITSIMSFRERFADEEPQQQQGRPRSDGMW